jgi:hypothetical protein
MAKLNLLRGVRRIIRGAVNKRKRRQREQAIPLAARAYEQSTHPPEKFTDISERDWETLSHKIKAAGGKVIVLVHPLLMVHGGKHEFGHTPITSTVNSKAPPNSVSHGLPKYSTVYSNSKAALKQTKTPVIVFEEYDNLHESHRLLNNHGFPKPLFVPTAKDQGLIRGGPPKKRGVLLDEVNQPFNERLKACGATTVLVGGFFTGTDSNTTRAKDVYAYEKKWLGKRRKPFDPANVETITHAPVSQFCAGQVYKSLIVSGLFKRQKVRWMPGMILNEFHDSIDYKHPRPFAARKKKN